MAITSPFPGMDPWVEQRWGDMHQRLITYTADRIQGRLPRDLLARMEERVLIKLTDERARSIYPDVDVVEQPAAAADAAVALAEPATAAAEPLIVRVTDEPPREGFIEITDTTGERVVTVVEYLSPANKLPGIGQDLYLRKQHEVRSGRVNLVEIDLVRIGRHVLSVPEDLVPSTHRTPYRVCVSRGNRGLEHEVYRVPLRDRLPVIRIPLRPTDPDVTLDLQAVFEQAYANGRYDRSDYRNPPYPPLSPADAAWADEVLREKGRR